MARSTLFWGRPVRRGLLSALCTALFLILISALIFHFTPISEAFLPITSLGILAVSTFGGGFVGAREAGIKGFLHGIVIGSVFFVLVTILALIIGPAGVGLMILIKKLLVCVIAGVFGGIIGVSMS